MGHRECSRRTASRPGSQRPRLRESVQASSRLLASSTVLRAGDGSRYGVDCEIPRAPKVSVTRERVSLCQKGVTPWLLFLVNCFCAWKRAKTSRGAGGVLPSTRPPAVERGRTPLEGGLGGSLVGRVIHSGALFNRVLIARSAHH